MSLIKYNNNSISAVTSASSLPSGALVPIKTLEADGSGTALTFHHGSSDVIFDATYPIYYFEFIKIGGINISNIINNKTNFRRYNLKKNTFIIYS